MNYYDMEESDPYIRRRLFRVLSDDTAMIAIIPPYKPFEMIPNTSTKIRSQEANDLKRAITIIREKGIKKLFILVDSLLGAAQAPIDMVKELMEGFSHIIIFVPHTSGSSGNLVISIGDKTVMGAAEEIIDRLKFPCQDEITPFTEVKEILNDGLIEEIENRELWGLLKDWIRIYIKKKTDEYVVRLLLPNR
ncbi:MAG: hypothetical protein SVY15_01480 [Halobacteriota archaeon]|nr:hypothetical protein [Halobacteriota archaeon]